MSKPLTYQEVEKGVIANRFCTDHLLWKIVNDLKPVNITTQDKCNLQSSLFKPINDRVMDVETKLRLLKGKRQKP